MSSVNGEENAGIPDDLRCKRTDGKQWRCTAMSMPDKTVCEKHYVQAKRRAVKSASRLKRKSLLESNNYLEDQDDFTSNAPSSGKYSSNKEKRLKRQIQYSPETPICVDSSECTLRSNDESSSREVGMYDESYRSYKTPFIAEMDCFLNRSHQSMTPMEDSGANTDASAECVGQTCHHCGRNDGDSLVSCLSCNRRAFCETCVSTWYPEVAHEEVEKICPACRGLCNCKPCLRSDNTLKVRIQEIPILDKLQYLYRILSAVLPVIKQIHCEQCAEVELEKKLRGTEIDLVRARLKVDEKMCCNICWIPIVDYYRHCSVCSYDLCLRCCQDIRTESSVEIKDRASVQSLKLNFSYKFPEWKANSDGSIPCPPKEYGGCGFGSLNLARVFKMNWVAKLVKNAEEMVNGCKVLDTGDLREFSESGHNFVYKPSLETIKSEGVRDFVKQLGEGRVAVVEGVLDESLFHSWDPEVTWKDMVDEKPNEEDSLVKAADCLDGSEVDVRLSEFMKVYREGRSRENGLPVLWKLKEWPSPSATEDYVFNQRPEFIRRLLPFLEYIHPRLGVLNIAAKLPLYSLQDDSGPKIYVSCGSYEELGQGDSVTHLHYNMRDMVYLLVHTSEGKVEKPAEEADLLDDQKMESSCMDCGGARWDIFRRQDCTKLAEYLKVHRSTFEKPEYLIDDFASCSLYEGHYLNEEHKRRLKDEFGVEPWSFEQRRGEAIFIPAGSPFQVRNLKSNVQIAFDFLFPESVGEAVRLAEEIRFLPNDHDAKHQILEIGKISLYAASSAIKEVQKLVLDPKLGAELGFDDPNLTKAVTEKLDNAVKRPQQISCQ